MQFQAQADQAVHMRLHTDLADGAILQIYGPQGQTLLGQAQAYPGQEAVVQIDAVQEAITYICVVSGVTLLTEDGQANDWPTSYSLEVIIADANDLVAILEIASDNIDFGATQINSTPGIQSIEITNSGLLPVKIEDITIDDSNDFAPVLYFPLPISIDPNSTGGFAVEFYPTSVGPYTGTMILTTNDPDQPFVELTLTGLGIDEPDDIAPESSASAWTADPSYPSIVVSWSGWDGIGGSGIAWYDVYVSIDGGEYKLWQFRTTETSAVYPGQSGHTYAFYSIATDKAGNVEPAPAEPDVEIAITEP
jgi:hypothetical protein